MADLGKVVVTDGGNYSDGVTYEELTFVHYQNDAYLTLKTVKDITPTDDGINYKQFCKSAVLATASKAGIVLPDGTTTTVDSNGKMSVKKATTEAAGIVKPAATDFTLESDGTQKLKTSFTQVTALANIVANEAWLTILGKIAKAIASLMDLSSKALMKASMSGIDANDSNKVPTSAFIHTLVERIGMGTSMTSGYGDLTAGLNSVKQGLDQVNSDLTSGLNKKVQPGDFLVKKVPLVSTNMKFAAGETKDITINSDYSGYTKIGVAGYNLSSYDFTIGSIVDISIAIKNNSGADSTLTANSYVAVLYVKNR